MEATDSEENSNLLCAEDMNEYPVKVRKPYTISKQREKWTEDEHEKFLEALKLYGRAWRQIQEHIGTKTAVQIRSHAQKFFSKVAREPGTEKAAEIPPPRPKRKPLHPYPRKFGNLSTTGIPVIEQPKVAPLPTSSGSDQENGSPVSVLSTVGSVAFCSSVSIPSNVCTSPVSSDGRNPLCKSPVELDNWYQSATSSAEDVYISSPAAPSPSNACLITQDKSDMELGLDSKEVQETSLKLFGKTLVVTDSEGACSSAVSFCQESSAAVDASTQSGSSAINLQCPNQGALQTSVPWFSFDGSRLPFHSGESMEAGLASLHFWWAYYGYLSPYLAINSQGTTAELSESQMGAGKDAGLSTDCVRKAKRNDDDKNCMVLDSPHSYKLEPSKNSAFVRVQRSNGGRSGRGFLPYKRHSRNQSTGALVVVTP